MKTVVMKRLMITQPEVYVSLVIVFAVDILFDNDIAMI